MTGMACTCKINISHEVYLSNNLGTCNKVVLPQLSQSSFSLLAINVVIWYFIFVQEFPPSDEELEAYRNGEVRECQNLVFPSILLVLVGSKSCIFSL